MNGLVLSIGIAMTFLTTWGVVMVGSYLLGRTADDPPRALVTDGPRPEARPVVRAAERTTTDAPVSAWDVTDPVPLR